MKEIKEIATKIVQYEKELEAGSLTKEDYEKFLEGLTLEEMLAVDEYIYQNKMLEVDKI